MRRATGLLLAVALTACSQTTRVEVVKRETRTERVEQGVDGGVLAVGGGATQTGSAGVGATRSSAGPAAAEQRLADGPIRIGVLSTLSGGQKFVGEPPYRVALAYAERLNAAGGINGRKIEVLGYDVCTNCPDEGLAQAKKAVERDNVFALANTFVVNAALDQVVPYLNQKGIPMVQGSSGEQSRKPELSPYNFSIGMTVPGRASVGADYVKAYLQKKGRPLKVSLLYFTDALTTYIAEQQRAALKRVGIQIVDEEPVTYDATMTNQTSQVVKMRAAGAEMVVGSHGVLCAFNMQAAEQNSWDAPYLCTIMYDPFTAQIAGPAALTDRDVFADTEGYATMDLPGPGVRDFKALMHDYYPDGGIGLITLYSYLGMRVIEEGLRSMGSNVTRAGLARYVEGLKNYDAGGLTPPFSLGPDDHGGIDGTHIVKLRPDGGFDRVTSDWVYPSSVHKLPGPSQ
jgi:branched-chain amino acid transport system substrate-binding protein